MPAPPRIFRKIGLVGRSNSPAIAGPLREVGEFLRQSGLEVILEAETARVVPLPGYPCASAESLGQAVDLVVVLGGDGTMLSLARRVAPHDVGIVGINQGRLGFLTDVALSDMRRALADVLAGRYIEEARTLLDVELLRGGAIVQQALAFNEAALSRGDSGGMLDCNVKIDGTFVYALRADGLIVTTPTGSTAYSLSAQGPIVHPQVEAFALVPVAPHALTNRPIVVSDRCEVFITLLRGSGAGLHCDGQSNIALQEGDAIRVRRSPWRVRLLHPPGYDYFSTLRQKLHWSETPDKLNPHF